MSNTSSNHITGSHNATNSGNATTTNSNNTTDISRIYHKDSKHIERHIYNVGRDGSKTRSRRHNKILKSLGPLTEKSAFLGLLPPMTNQDERISKIAPIQHNDPKLYWIFQDIDFKDWESTNRSQVLWLFGPPDRGITEVSSHFVSLAKQKASQTEGAVFYFFCSMLEMERSVATIFTNSVLRHILNGSGDDQAKKIVSTFLSTLLDKVLERDKSRFRKEDSSTTTAKKILDASDSELLEALTKAVDEVKEIQETSIIIDRIDILRKEGAQFLEKFCSQAIINPKFKALLTCRSDPHIQDMVVEVFSVEYKERRLCIEYDKERQECLYSLRHHGTRYDKISTEHGGTLEWLWEHKKYMAWSSTSHSDLLLIEGKPGSGKSTLTKYFKDNLPMREPLAENAIVASFFYSYRDGELHTNHSNMLCSILYDVLHQNETFFYHFQSLYRKAQQHGEWPYGSLKEILLSLKEHPTKERLYIIVDAIDESDDNDRHDIIRLLHQLCATKKLCIVKVFLASRPIVNLNHTSTEIENIIKMQDENGSDILKFAESFLAKLKLSTTCYHDTKDYIIQNAQGVFVWVYLVQKELLEYHATGYRNKDIFDFLRSLPTELDDFYGRMLRELEDKSKQRDVKDAVRMFQLVLFAERPVTVSEIQQALAISDDDDDEYSPSDESFEGELIDDNNIVKRIIHCGGNFLDIKGNDIVQFTHQTALTFFSRLLVPTATSKFRMSKDDACRRISVICIRYIMLIVARSTPENEPQNMESWEPAHFEKYAEYLNRRPFIDYALTHLQQHKNDCAQLHQLRKNDCSECINVERYILQLSKQLANNLASLLFESWIDSYLGSGIAVEKKRQVAKGFRKNILRITKSWIGSGKRLDAAANEKRLAAKDFRNNMLHTATRMQYSRAVEALLTAGTDTEACLVHKTPLLVSVETGDVATAGVLLRKGARIDVRDDKQQTALLLAATKGHDTMVSLLVNSGANKEERDNVYERTALHLAASNGHDSTVLLLVKILGADKEVKDKINWTALHHAAWNGHDSTVRLLVETLGADMGAKDHIGSTLLHLAASGGHES
ncbi:hypothetical protein BDD12DRAFT_785326, partial [Trichophaea hybrida]